MFPPQFHGTNVIFWVGVVEDRDDSKATDKLKLGRVRVRVLGFHSASKTEDNQAGEGIPTDKLHWAYPVGPVTSASVSGKGQTPLGVVEGTWVMGFAMDGPAMQDLYILGTLAGVPQELAKPANGFYDPNGKYPLKEFIGESDINRLARGDDKQKHPMLDRKEKAREKNIPTASGHIALEGPTWDEPGSDYAAKYPYNHVHESESGHITEIDDSPCGERLHQWHRSGTYREIQHDGSEVHKIVGHDFEIVVKNKNVYIGGNCSITVHGQANILVEQDCNIQAEKNCSIQTKENMILNAQKSLVMTAKDIMIVATGGGLTMTAAGPIQAIGANTDPSDVASGIL